MKRIMLMFVVSCCVSSPLFGQVIEHDRQTFANMIHAAQVNSGVPGIVAALVDADETVIVTAGLRANPPAAPVHMGQEDTMNIGSNFKAMTATIAARLVQQGAIQWDSTLGQVFPEHTATMHSAFKDVTLLQLLSHTGGAGNDDVLGAIFLDDGFTGNARETRTHYVPIITAQAPFSPIGTYEYSNIGYSIAGAMLEKVTNQDFDALVTSELRTPLNMPSLIRGSAGTNDFINVPQPLGHGFDGLPQLPEEEGMPVGIEPAGLYSLTVNDWANFTRMHLGVLDGAPNFLSHDLIETMHTRRTDTGEVLLGSPVGYALGWTTLDVNGQTLLFHNGSNLSWLSAAILNPATDRAVLFASNQFEPGSAALVEVALDSDTLAWLGGAVLVPEPNSVFTLVLMGAAFYVIRRRKRVATQELESCY